LRVVERERSCEQKQGWCEDKRVVENFKTRVIKKKKRSEVGA